MPEHMARILDFLACWATPAAPSFEHARAVPGALGRGASPFARYRAAAEALAEGEVVPDVIVVAQAFPGQFSHEAIDRLRRLAPLARWSGLMGSWCEGEDANRLALAGGRADILASMAGPLPAAVSPSGPRRGRCVDAAADGHRGRAAAGRRGRRVWPQRAGLVTSSIRDRARWPNGCRRHVGAGGSPPFGSGVRRPSSGRRRGGHLRRAAGSAWSQWDELARLAAALRPAPVIALLAFPRTEDDAQARSAGAAAVLSKPLAVDDLFWELEYSGVSAGDGRLPVAS